MYVSLARVRVPLANRKEFALAGAPRVSQA